MTLWAFRGIKIGIGYFPKGKINCKVSTDLELQKCILDSGALGKILWFRLGK